MTTQRSGRAVVDVFIVFLASQQQCERAGGVRSMAHFLLQGHVLELGSTIAQRAFPPTSLGLRKARIQPVLMLRTSKLGIDESS